MFLLKSSPIIAHWTADSNLALAGTVYGVIKRLPNPFGLHHIWNVLSFFEVGSDLDPTMETVITGEIQHYIVGRPDHRQHDWRLSIQDVEPTGGDCDLALRHLGWNLSADFPVNA